jgi:N-acetylmuramidase/Putative peptidoglycan binding domain
MPATFTAKALPMSRQGLGLALDKLQMGPGQAAALWAVFEVETAGTTQGFGFRADRRPQILFERHKFRQYTNGQFDTEAPDISGPQGAYGPLALQYPKLEKALSLCANAGLGSEPALKSASWGIGQVMGFNHAAAGFDSAQKMVSAMVESEDAQLQAMVNFLQSNGLAQALKNQDWAKFARIYNGPSYAKNQYDVKLEQQYARFSTGSTPDLEVRSAQAALLLLGYSVGKIDGVVGKRTRDGLRGFQLTASLPVTGELDGATFSALWAKAFG